MPRSRPSPADPRHPSAADSPTGDHGSAGTPGRLGPAWALAWLAACAGLVLVAPLAPALGGLLFCPWKALAGFPCPLCGTTRAALALAELRPLHALTTYPLPTLAWVAFFAGGISCGAVALAGGDLSSVERAWRSLRQGPRSRLPWLLLAVAVLASWIYSIATGV